MQNNSFFQNFEMRKPFYELELIEIYKANQIDLNAIGKELLKQTKGLKNDLDGLWIVHSTNYLPEKGIIKPRLGYTAEGSNLGKEKEKFISESFSVMRSTVHFCLNKIAEDHEDNIGLSNQKVVVLDKLSSQDVQSQLIAGYIEDLFAFGPYKLSKDSVMLIEESYYKEMESKINKEDFGRIITFKGPASEAAKKFFEEEKIEQIQYLSYKNLGNMYLFGKLGEKLISSSKVCELLKIKFKDHATTVLGNMEDLIVYGFGEVVTNQKSINNAVECINYAITSAEKFVSFNPIQKKCLVKWSIAAKQMLSSCIKVLNNASIKDVDNSFMNYDSEIFNAELEYTYLLSCLKTEFKSDNISLKHCSISKQEIKFELLVEDQKFICSLETIYGALDKIADTKKEDLKQLFIN